MSPLSTRVALCIFTALFPGIEAEAAPRIETWETGNGARVYFVQAPELPMVDIRVVFDAGSARDGERFGLATLTNATLAEGAGALSAHELSERFEHRGARFDSGALRDMAWAGLRSIVAKDHLEPAVDTLALIIAKPDFPEAAVERQRKRMLVALQQKQQSPADLAEDAFYQAVYGDHPYAHDPSGTAATLEALTRTHLADFHQTFYTGANAVVAIVGQRNRAQAEVIAEAVVQYLPAGKRPPPIAAVKALSQSEEVRIDYPSAQTHIIIGQPGMKRNDPDYFALYLGNHSLGGSGLSSLLAEEVREKRGLSYNVASYFEPMREYGPFSAGLQTQNEQAEQALSVLKETITQYVKNGPTPEQIKSSKQNITGGFPLRIDSNSKIVEYLAMIGFYELPLDYLSAFNARIEALDGTQVRNAMQNRLRVENMVTVIVGPVGGKK